MSNIVILLTTSFPLFTSICFDLSIFQRKAEIITMMIVIFLLYNNRVQLSILPIPKSLARLKFGKLAKNSVWWHKVS